MANEDAAKAQISKIFGLSKETELMQSFVRIGIDEDAEAKANAEAEGAEAAPKERASSPKQSMAKTLSGKQIFKQIKQEMKNKVTNKRKRCRRDEEEVYTDKDRAAAVNMGSKDIKQSLHQKAKQDRTKAMAMPEEADPGTLLALGRNEIRGGNFQTAIAFVNKALELRPNEKNALVARSKCYLLLGEPKLALEDAETALKMDKTFIKAIYQKAEALYYLGDFELSLMFYHRGLRIRPELEGFRLGIQKAQEAIENTIGTSKTLIDIKSLSPSPMTSPSDFEKTITPTPATPSPNLKPEKPNKKAKELEKRLSRQLLGQLCVDKEYLENLLQNPDLNSGDRKASNIIAHAEEAVQFLNKRQEFWRQQRPSTTVTSRRKSGKHNNLGPFPKWYDHQHQL